ARRRTDVAARRAVRAAGFADRRLCIRAADRPHRAAGAGRDAGERPAGAADLPRHRRAERRRRALAVGWATARAPTHPRGQNSLCLCRVAHADVHEKRFCPPYGLGGLEWRLAARVAADGSVPRGKVDLRPATSPALQRAAVVDVLVPVALDQSYSYRVP